MGAPTIHSRVIFCRDESGRLNEVRIESEDPKILDEFSRKYRALERTSEAAAKRWRETHSSFTDLNIDPGSVSQKVEGKGPSSGYPWEGPRFSFSLLLGESPTWSGPESLWLGILDKKGRVKWVCRYCSHYSRGLPLTAYCINCDRSGRDLVIPKGEPRPSRKRPPKTDGMKGGMEGKK